MEKSRKVLIGWVVGVLLFCGLGGWATWRFSDFGQADAELDRAIADAKAAGLPWVAEDMNPKPPVKDEENAAPFITRALKLRTQSGSIKSALSKFKQAQTDFDEPGKADSLKELGPMMAMARQAGDQPRCDFKRDWDQGAWLLLPEFAVEKDLCKLLSAQAVIEAKAGQTANALKDLRRAVRIGEHGGSEPILIGAMVGIACDAIALRGAEQIAEAWHGDAGRLSVLRKALSDLGPEPDFMYALRGEVYMGISVNRNLRGIRDLVALNSLADGGDSSEKYPKPDKLVRDGKPQTVFGRIFLCRHLQMWTRVWKDPGLTNDPLAIGKKLDEIQAKEEQAGWSHLLNRILMPVFTQAGQAVVKMHATRSVGRGLVAALEFKARQGAYPKSLAEAGFEELDPFSGKPLGLIVDGDKCRVYSVGPDRKDNHGLRQSERPTGINASDDYDVVASYPAYRKAKVKGPQGGPPPAPAPAASTPL
jgi:hypothetical protein